MKYKLTRGVKIHGIGGTFRLERGDLVADDTHPAVLIAYLVDQGAARAVKEKKQKEEADNA